MFHRALCWKQNKPTLCPPRAEQGNVSVLLFSFPLIWKFDDRPTEGMWLKIANLANAHGKCHLPSSLSILRFEINGHLKLYILVLPILNMSEYTHASTIMRAPLQTNKQNKNQQTNPSKKEELNHNHQNTYYNIEYNHWSSSGGLKIHFKIFYSRKGFRQRVSC